MSAQLAFLNSFQQTHKKEASRGGHIPPMTPCGYAAAPNRACQTITDIMKKHLQTSISFTAAC